MINTRTQESSKQFWHTSSYATTFLKGNRCYTDEKSKPRSIKGFGEGQRDLKGTNQTLKKKSLIICLQKM